MRTILACLVLLSLALNSIAQDLDCGINVNGVVVPSANKCITTGAVSDSKNITCYSQLLICPSLPALTWVKETNLFTDADNATPTATATLAPTALRAP